MWGENALDDSEGERLQQLISQASDDFKALGHYAEMEAFVAQLKGRPDLVRAKSYTVFSQVLRDRYDPLGHWIVDDVFKSLGIYEDWHVLRQNEDVRKGMIAAAGQATKRK